jgi:hypothetical protein
MQHLYKKMQHFLREIWRYAQRHPYKVFFMVIMPLVSGGVLHKLARQFGVNLPEMGGSGARGGYSGSGHTSSNNHYSGGGASSGYYGSQGYGMESSRSGPSNGGGGMMAGLGNIDMQSVSSGIGGLASLASMASKFMYRVEEGADEPPFLGTVENIFTITRVVGNLTGSRNDW